MRAITVEFDWRTCGANLNSCALCRNYISAIAVKISFRQAAAVAALVGAAVAALVRASGRQSLGERGRGRPGRRCDWLMRKSWWANKIESRLLSRTSTPAETLYLRCNRFAERREVIAQRRGAHRIPRS